MAAQMRFFAIPMSSTQRACLEACRKLHPRHQLSNPVLFAVELGSIALTLLWAAQVALGVENPRYALSIALWLWLTLWLSNFAEAIAEGHGKAHAEALRLTRRDLNAKKLVRPHTTVSNPTHLTTGEWVMQSVQSPVFNHPTDYEIVAASTLRKGNFVLVEAGDSIPCDGEVVAGVATVDESAVSGGSVPIVRESGCDRNAVTGGTRVLTDWLVVQITANPGETFIDRVIQMVEGAERKKTPREVLLNMLLVVISIVFLLVTSALLMPMYRGEAPPFTLGVLFTLFVSLIPTTIGSVFATIGIVGVDRMMQANVVALSGRAVEAAGKVDVLLLDKTGTITLGNRQAVEFVPVDGSSLEILIEAIQWATHGDETTEGRSITILASERYGATSNPYPPNPLSPPAEKGGVAAGMQLVPFSAQTRMSGIDHNGRMIRKGAPDAIEAHVTARGGYFSTAARAVIDNIAQQGGTPLVVIEGTHVLGVIHLKDTVKGGIRERFAELRSMGIRTVMMTGDNTLTAAVIASEAGVDDFFAQATPEDKLNLIYKMQAQGKLVAMAGDGTNDAPALAQADVAVAMNTGTRAAKESCNVIDLDSNPTKLIEIVKIGRQLLVTRGALTLFCGVSDVAKYAAVVPAVLAMGYPSLNGLNIMGLHTPQSALLSAVMFNALMVIFLIPLALRGIPHRPLTMREYLLRYAVGGFVIPFIGIKLIDLMLTILNLV
jgi:potassium-transporting ATPase ATP-binding subunit